MASAISIWACSACASLMSEGVCATASTGPLTPSPSLSFTSLYAWYCVLSTGELAADGRPMRIWPIGMAIAPSTSTPAIMVSTGRASTIFSQPCGDSSRFCSSARRAAIFCGVLIDSHAFFGSALRPIRASTAGVRVTEISTATNTHSAAASPIYPRNGIPVTFRASKAIITVTPANTTALPLVPLASAMEARMGIPFIRLERCLLRMNSE